MPALPTAEQSFRSNLSGFRWGGSNNAPQPAQESSGGNPFSRFYNTVTTDYIPLRSNENSNEEEAWFALSRWERLLGFGVCMLGAAVCFFVAFITLPLLVLKPAKFALSFSLGSFLVMFGFSVLIGPINHVKHLISKERLPFSLVYFGSLGLTLYSSLGAHSYLGSLIFGGIQVVALVAYVLAYFPGGTQTLRLGGSLALRGAGSLLPRMWVKQVRTVVENVMPATRAPILGLSLNHEHLSLMNMLCKRCESSPEHPQKPMLTTRPLQNAHANMATTTYLTTSDVLASANELLAEHAALISRTRSNQQQHRRGLHSLQPTPHELLRLPLISSPSRSPSPTDSEPPSPVSKPRVLRPDLSAVKQARATRYRNYVPEEETIRNDYSQRYVDGGEWPQNWVLGAEPDHRFEEYPKQQRLLNLKKASVNNHSLPPTYLHYSQLTSLQPTKFDVILLDPPFSSSFTWDNLQELPIPSLAADPSFVFLWVGSGAGEGLERGREILARWGYRRCEDVVWVKTNKTTNEGPGTDMPTTSLLTRTKQHCLIGIRGTVRRSTDSWFVHCNVDTDVIIWEGDLSDPTRKPPEMYTLIENFCLGIRRLEVFGRPSSLRRGWVTVLGPGQEEHLQALEDGTVHVAGNEGGRGTLWNKEAWDEGVKEISNGGKPVVPMTSEIDALRPKSPVRGGDRANQAGGGGAGQGAAPGGGGGAVGGGGGGGGGIVNNRFIGGTGGGGGGGHGMSGGGGGLGGGVRMGVPGGAGGAGFGNMIPGGGPMMGQNQMAGVQPGMMGMNMAQLMANNGVNMEDMMMGNPGGGWNPAMGGPGMGGMNVGGVPGMGMMNPGGMGGMMTGSMGNHPNMNPGMGPGGMPMNMMNQMGGQMGNQMGGPMGQMQGQMGMNPNAGFGQGMPGMFNPAMNNWGDQGQFAGDGNAWEGDGMTGMGGMGMPNGMMGGGHGMGMGGMNQNPMNMNQWGGGGNRF